MAKIDEKMHMIGSAITDQAEAERRSIIDKANAMRDKAVNEYKEQIIEQMFERLQQETRAVRQKAVRDRAQAERQAHRELLTRRGELTASVFGAVKTRLLEYAGTSAYRDALLNGIREAAAGLGWNHRETTVLLREEDLPLEARIAPLLPGCTVKATRRIRLGGFQLRNTGAGILLDETLDSRLEDQRTWFLSSCGLKTV